MTDRADIIVLGLGTCGEDAALRLLDQGLSVIGVEERLIGGECPYYACLPTKSLVRSANLVAEARRADGLVGTVSVDPDWSLVAGRLRDEVTGGWDDTGAATRFEERGGRLIRGRGAFAGPRSIRVGDATYEATRGIVIATGSTPLVPQIPGLDAVDHWTTREALAAEELPRSLVILGGGPVGCELAQVFTRFGVDVTIVEGANQLLPSIEPEGAAVVTAALMADGVKVVTGSRASQVTSSPGGVIVGLDDGRAVGAERLLVALGRTVDTSDLGLNEAHVSADGGFVRVDGRLRAANGIWAIGDVTGKGLLTQVALYQSSIAVADVLGSDPMPADYSNMARAVFTDPEVGVAGLTEAEARSAGIDVEVVTKAMGATFRGWLHRTGNDGMVKLVASKAEDRLVGGTVVGPHASDVAGFIGLAIREHVPLEHLVDSIYVFPSFYGAVGEAIGAYGRGIGTVLDPGNPPLFTD